MNGEQDHSSILEPYLSVVWKEAHDHTRGGLAISLDRRQIRFISIVVQGEHFRFFDLKSLSMRTIFSLGIIPPDEHEL